MTIEEFIATLEDTEVCTNADDVAEFLYTYDLLGVPGHDSFCPVARGIRACGKKDVYVGEDDAGWRNDEYHYHVWQNEAISEFIALFDGGFYPELIQPGTADRKPSWLGWLLWDGTPENNWEYVPSDGYF